MTARQWETAGLIGWLVALAIWAFVALSACRGERWPRTRPPATTCAALVADTRAAIDAADMARRRVVLALVLVLLETACAPPAEGAGEVDAGAAP